MKRTTKKTLMTLGTISTIVIAPISLMISCNVSAQGIKTNNNLAKLEDFNTKEEFESNAEFEIDWHLEGNHPRALLTIHKDSNEMKKIKEIEPDFNELNSILRNIYGAMVDYLFQKTSNGKYKDIADKELALQSSTDIDDYRDTLFQLKTVKSKGQETKDMIILFGDEMDSNTFKEILIDSSNHFKDSDLIEEKSMKVSQLIIELL